MSNGMKVGLVLSGGGAKGAYQVGMLKALNQMGVQINAISGASIGALNGAILAASPSIGDGVIRLENLWKSLAKSSPLKVKQASYLTLLAAAGLKLNGSAYLGFLFNRLNSLAKAYNIPILGSANISQTLNSGLLSDEPLQKLMNEYLDSAALNAGLPFYVSVYQSDLGLMDMLKVFVAELGFRDTNPSTFFHVQSLPEDQQKELLLASAALPMVFTPREVNGVTYSDGGQGGWSTMQGNTPVQPLIDSGCNMIIVSHLCNGSLWSRRDFPDTTFLEIRPKSSLSRGTGMMSGTKDLLGFDESKILSWIEQGYQDTLASLSSVINTCMSRLELQGSEKALLASEENNDKADLILASALSRL